MLWLPGCLLLLVLHGLLLQCILLLLLLLLSGLCLIKVKPDLIVLSQWLKVV